jgi:catechol 2,3-dioxygenase-like lactoylglutathione lyase family enzyme
MSGERPPEVTASLGHAAPSFDTRMRARKRAALDRWFGGLAALCALCPALAQPSAAAPPAVLGIYNWIHSTADAERAFAFYRDVLGMELTRSPFAGPAAGAAPPPRITPAKDAGSDPLVWDLTNTHGRRFRTVFMEAPNTPFGLELSEFFDIPRGARVANAWDPGASILIFAVRDVDAALASARARGAPVVTIGGAPVATPDGRAVVVRDPDGYLIELVEASAAALGAAAPGVIVGTSIGITVASTPTALEFYARLLGIGVRSEHRATDAELRLNGLDAGALTQTTLAMPGGASLVLAEFTVPAGAAPPAPFEWRLQDVGSPQLQLDVRALDELVARTKAAGYRFLSVGAKPISRPFGRFVFAIDPDGVLVEYVEPARRD